MKTIYIEVSDSLRPEGCQTSIFSHMQTTASPEKELARIRRAAIKKGLTTVTYNLVSQDQYLAYRRMVSDRLKTQS